MIGIYKTGKGGLKFFTQKRLFSLRYIFKQFRKMSDDESQGSTGSFGASSHFDYLKKIEDFIPKLTSSLHKGECGRIGIIGGSDEYTGAPYFAAISALKTGADIIYVFCCRESALAIKSYSPELIVNPILDSEDVIEKVKPWIPKLHALVIGPGLGRKEGLLQNVKEIITYCKENVQPPPPLIIDADGLYLITENLSLVQDYNGPVILTPNPVEFRRLQDKFPDGNALQIASELNCVILQKGFKDVITNGIQSKALNLNSEDVTIQCEVAGSKRRCGGQGDVLAGCTATFIAWFQLHMAKQPEFDFSTVEPSDSYEGNLALFKEKYFGYSLAAYAACAITKTCSRYSFEEFGRGMTASDLIPFIHKLKDCAANACNNTLELVKQYCNLAFPKCRTGPCTKLLQK